MGYFLTYITATVFLYYGTGSIVDGFKKLDLGHLDLSHLILFQIFFIKNFFLQNTYPNKMAFLLYIQPEGGNAATPVYCIVHRTYLFFWFGGNILLEVLCNSKLVSS